MAIQNNKYNNSMIYTIRSPHTDKFYIGSTTQKLCKRFANHKSKYNTYVNNLRYYVSSYKIIELGDSYIELLEEINCDTKTQLEMREGELIRLHKDLCINKIMVGRTPKQYILDNAYTIKQYQKQYNNQYYIDNADMIKQNNKQYYLDNIDKKKQYLLDNADKIKQRSKQYKQDNADMIKQYRKQYLLDNADKIKQREKQYKQDNADKIKQRQKQYRQDNADKIKQLKKQYNKDNAAKIKQYYLYKKTPKINIAKEDYDLLIHCDKLMNIQYSYKKLIIV